MSSTTTGSAHTGPSGCSRRIQPSSLPSEATISRAESTGATCSADSCTSTEELHERICAPYEVVADRPDLVVRSRAEYLDTELRGADLILRVLYGLLALALVIGILGVVNTLALSVLERTREIGLLRAVGLSRRQLRTVIRVESALIALVGGELGIGGG
jgi:ABC-type antimicrobial peptide transport system permease subunit